MTPEEHAAEAERLLTYAERFALSSPARADALRFASVHATLSTRSTRKASPAKKSTSTKKKTARQIQEESHDPRTR